MQHLGEVNDAVKIARLSSWHINQDGLNLKALLDTQSCCLQLRTQSVKLVDEADARHAELIGLHPYGLTLRLNAHHAIKDGHGSIADPERPLHLSREIHVTWRVNQVDLVSLPVEGHSSCPDRDTTLAFLLHVVHDSVAVVDLTRSSQSTCVVQHALSDCRFASVDMSDDPDIPNHIDV